jgi:tubulin beta
LDVFYTQVERGNYVPRSVFVDLEQSSLDAIKSGLYGQIFRPENFISTSSSGGNNWVKGFYTEGQEIAESIMDVIRKEVEECDSLQGFQFTHFLGGGTGSGLGTLLINHLRERYPDRILSSYSIFPSPQFSDIVVEIYNTTLSFNHLTENANVVFCFDNQALFDICNRHLKLSNPTYQDLNHLISLIMSGTTCSLRFLVK